MTKESAPPESLPAWLPIAAVERATGLSKDSLRVWERRYGFPQPGRDALGERGYPRDQVDKLRLLKRLLDAGHRPGRIVGLPIEALQDLAGDKADPLPATGPGRVADLAACLEQVRNHDVEGLRRGLAMLLLRLGLMRFVLEVLTPLHTLVGDAWMRGQLEVFEEHAYTESVQAVLRGALASVGAPPPGARPQVLLSTFPGEPHGLGLLMAEAVLTLEGCRCVSLGVMTPLWDTAQAALAYRADIVALSFTGGMNPNQVSDGLAELRAKLPAGVELWAGGSAPVLHRRPVPGVLALASMDELPSQLERWRQAHAAGPASA